MPTITTASNPAIDLIDQQSDTISYARLAQAVIIQAAKEAAAGDQNARAWLLSGETAETWGVLAGLSWQHVRAWVLAGCVLPRRGAR